MDLKKHFAPETESIQFSLKVDHGQLDNVRSSTLYRHVYCHPLSGFPYLPVGGAEFRDIALASQDRLDITLFLCLLPGGLEELLHTGISLEI